MVAATRTDSMQAESYPASSTFNQTFSPYVVATSYGLNTTVRLDVTLTFASGARPLRRITHTVANSGK